MVQSYEVLKYNDSELPILMSQIDKMIVQAINQGYTNIAIGCLNFWTNAQDFNDKILFKNVKSMYSQVKAELRKKNRTIRKKQRESICCGLIQLKNPRLMWYVIEWQTWDNRKN